MQLGTEWDVEYILPIGFVSLASIIQSSNIVRSISPSPCNLLPTSARNPATNIRSSKTETMATLSLKEYLPSPDQGIPVLQGLVPRYSQDHNTTLRTRSKAKVSYRSFIVRSTSVRD